MDLDTSWCPTCDRQVMPQQITVYPAAPAKTVGATNGTGLVHGTGRTAAAKAALKKSQMPRTVLSQEPTPLYCSPECRDADTRTGSDSDCSTSDDSSVFPRSISSTSISSSASSNYKYHHHASAPAPLLNFTRPVPSRRQSSSSSSSQCLSFRSTKGLVVPDIYHAREEEHDRLVQMRNINKLTRQCDELNLGGEQPRGDKRRPTPLALSSSPTQSYDFPSPVSTTSSLPTIKSTSSSESRRAERRRQSDLQTGKAVPRSILDGLHTQTDEPWTWAAADPSVVTYPVYQLDAGSIASSLSNKRLFNFTVKKPVPVLTEKQKRGW